MLAQGGLFQRRESSLTTCNPSTTQIPFPSHQMFTLVPARDSRVLQRGKGRQVKLMTCCLSQKKERRGSCWGTDPIQQQPKHSNPSHPGGTSSGSCIFLTIQADSQLIQFCFRTKRMDGSPSCQPINQTINLA